MQEAGLETLDVLVAELGECATPRRVAQTLASHARGLFGATAVVVAGPEPARDGVLPVLHHSPELKSEFVNRLANEAESPLRQALRARHASSMGAATAAARGWSHDGGNQAWIYQPLIIRQRPVGVLAMAHPPERAASLEGPMARLALRQCALALDRAYVHEHENQARDELAEEASRFKSLVQELDAVFWEGDPETFLFSFVSQRAEKMLGYPLRRWLELGFWASTIHPDDRHWAVDFCVQCTKEGEDHVFEYRMVDAAGRTRWIRDVVYVLRDGEGKPRLLRGVMLDVTKDRTDANGDQPQLAKRILQPSRASPA